MTSTIIVESHAGDPLNAVAVMIYEPGCAPMRQEIVRNGEGHRSFYIYGQQTLHAVEVQAAPLPVEETPAEAPPAGDGGAGT